MTDKMYIPNDTQILPFFKPEWTTSVKLVDALDEYFDIPTILTSVNNEEVYELSIILETNAYTTQIAPKAIQTIHLHSK